jgi:L-cysteine S-thiosulfotransferase
MMLEIANVRRPATGVILLIAAACLVACGDDPAPVKGFVLPEGDIERGAQVFASVGCRYCHTVTDVEMPPFDADPVLDIELGGKVYRVKTYGELLTSIVNPTHAVAAGYRAMLEAEERKNPQSPMPEFNDVINVTQLIDLTAFLHSRYELLAPQYRGYYYGP